MTTSTPTTMTPTPSDMAALAVGLLKESGSVAKAEVFARLAQAQQAKAQNIIDYLNSDRTKWSEADEDFVRSYLGLPALVRAADQAGAR